MMLAVLAVLVLMPAPPGPRGRTDPQTPSPPPFAPHEGSEREHRRLEVHDLVGLFPGRALRSVPSARGRVALTFDDGPDGRYTPQILDVLRAHRAHATFFVIGRMAERHPDVLRRMVREGHALASHGYGHIRYSAVPPEAARADLRRNEEVLARLAGVRPRLFRPPYGALDLLAARVVLDEGYLIVLWTVDTRDWLGRPAGEIAHAVLDGAGDGTIVLQHAASGGDVDLSGTVAALPDIIRGLRARGLEPVTVPELLAAPRAAGP